MLIFTIIILGSYLKIIKGPFPSNTVPDIFSQSKKNDSLVMMHTPDCRLKISGVSPSYETLGHLQKKMMMKIRISHMNDFSCGEMKVRNNP